MPRTRPRTQPEPSALLPAATDASAPVSRRSWLAVAGLLLIHYALAASSLIGENPTIDEVAHIPAGVTYWQTGSFKLYRHNPPLAKLTAALPVVAMRPLTGPAYQSRAAWAAEYPSQASFAQIFLVLNVDRWFELMRAARLVMPLWSVLGGLVVFIWSRRLWGVSGGLLSLAIWCFCPNILAHARLATSDIPSTSIGLAATFLFWCYLQEPTWKRAAPAGVVLGLAQLTKFSLLLLYGLWPLLWLGYQVATPEARRAVGKRLTKAIPHALAMVALSVLVIDAVYLFEGVGTPIGRFDFASRSFLTREGEDPRWRARPAQNPLIDVSWKHRVNRFRGSWLEGMPSPLPQHYLLGFDEQKIEADGIPMNWLDPQADPNENTGYPVYLDGTLRRHGWRDYYLKTLLYKLPEGTWTLFTLAMLAALTSRAARAKAGDELPLWLMPLSVLAAMSLLTDINLGLRYVLPILPYFFIGCGRLGPWASSFVVRARLAAWSAVGLPLAATILSSLAIHPHYLAYFNWASGGPSRGGAHLIDSNLDWGQDLVGLREWMRREAPGEPIGMAYFGQIPPSIFAVRGDVGFDWFLPPVLPRTIEPMFTPGRPRIGPAPRLQPGLYAVSVSILHGLPWRLHDPVAPTVDPAGWLPPSWNAKEQAFAYFRSMEPIANIGHSILIYRVTPEQAEALNTRHWPG